jgi:hypothetical protein
MGVITSAIAAAAVSAAAQSGPEAAPGVVVSQPSYITAAARLAPADEGAGVTTHVNRYARGEPVAQERPDLAVVPIRGLTPWEPSVHVVINPWVRQDGPIYEDFREFGANEGPYLGTNPATRSIEKTQERLERARQKWLRDNGHVGGVATFVNPAPDGVGSVEAPKPRATIRMPAGSSGGGNFRVEAEEGSAARDALARIEARRQALAQAAREQRTGESQQASAEATPAADDTEGARELSEEARTAQADPQR